MSDRFQEYSASLISPAEKLEPITPSDSSDLGTVTRALNVATGGTVQITTIGGDTATVTIAAGIAFPARVTRVWQTGTTATGIVGLS